MNEYILKVMSYIDKPDLFTSEEMKSNAARAARDARAASNAAAGHTATASAYTAYATHAAYVADTVSAYTARNSAAIDRFLEITKENKQDYIDEVERLR